MPSWSELIVSCLVWALGPECPLQKQQTITPSSAPIAPVTSSLLNFYPDGTVGDRCDRQSLTQDKISQRNVHELGLDQLISLSSSSRAVFASLEHVHTPISRLKEYHAFERLCYLKGVTKNFVNGIILYNLEKENIRNNNPLNMVIPPLYDKRLWDSPKGREKLNVWLYGSLVIKRGQLSTNI